MRYLNLRLVGSSELAHIDKMYPQRGSYPYSFVWYEIIQDDVLRVSPPDGDEIAKAVQSGRLAGKEEGNVVPVVSLIDSSENIANVFATFDYGRSVQVGAMLTRVSSAP